MALNIKDADRLEVTRFLDETGADAIYWASLNRPGEDIVQRTQDLNKIFGPARGFRVRQEIPATATVEIEAGTFVNGTVPTLRAQSTLLTLAAGASNRRIDIVFLNVQDGSISTIAGIEDTVSFSSLTRPTLPTDSRVPLAFLYVDDTPTPFDDTIAINNAGAIEDIRPSLGANVPIFEQFVSGLRQDSATGGVGTGSKIVRQDHAHPLNVGVILPAQTLPSSASSLGAADTYARANHGHGIAISTADGNFQTDLTGGDTGKLNTVPRSDHRHPLNVDGTIPAILNATATTGAVGASVRYARRDHVHELQNVPVGRALYGRVDGATGDIEDSGSGGWTSARTGTGQYTITFSAAFSTAPIPVGNGLSTVVGTNRLLVIESVTTALCELFVTDGEANEIDSDFFFFIIGV